MKKNILQLFIVFLAFFQSILNTYAQPVYVIPVVFHVLHEYGPENISDNQIKAFLQRLNDDFQKRNADTIDIVPQFQSIAADCQIEFRLAHFDPNGNCTNGIEHIQSMLTHTGGNAAKINQWPHDMYLNFWTVQNFTSGNSGTSPWYANLNPTKDGVILNIAYITDSTFTHQATQMVGKYLNLLYVFGTSQMPVASCEDDSVADTPVTKGWDHCPQPSQAAVCNTSIVENYQNFMDMSYCTCMFTQGQKARMHSCLNSSAGGRNNLWTPANLQATGTDSLNYPPCAPIADFVERYNMVCTGDSVIFTDISWNGPVANRQWIFTGGSPATSADSMPVVTYNSPGDYDVELQVSNATGSDTIVKIGTVHVWSQPAVIPYYDDFETAGTFPGNGYLVNYDNLNMFRRITTVGYSGTSSIIIANDSNTIDALPDEWYLPSLDFTNAVAPRFSFRWAYASAASSIADELDFAYSIDCGDHWNILRSYDANNLPSVSGTIPNFVPMSPAEWKTDSFALINTGGQNEVLIRIRLLYGLPGNNIYIDDINIYDASVGVKDVLNDKLNFQISPNPVIDYLQINLT